MQVLGIELMPSEEQPVRIAILQTPGFKEKCFYLYVHDGFDMCMKCCQRPRELLDLLELESQASVN